jgi:hypothetical protein
MYDQVLILPDGGADFMRTVRLAALYAETVHVFSPTQESTIDELSFLSRSPISSVIQEVLTDTSLAEGRESQQVAEQVTTLFPSLAENTGEHAAVGFIRASVANRSELALLQSEKVVRSILEDFVIRLSNGEVELEGLIPSLELFTKQEMPKAQVPDFYARSHSQPTICTLFELLWQVFIGTAAAAHEKKPHEFFNLMKANEDASTKIAVLTFFGLSSYYAMNNGCAAMTWDPSTQKLFDEYLRALTTTAPAAERQLKTEFVKNRLAQVILTDQVADVSALPIEEILEIRRKREPELKAFRNKLREIASEIDPTVTESELSIAIDKKVQSTVRPALDDLKASVEQSRLEAHRRLWSPNDALNKSLVPFAISTLSGASAAVEVTLSAAGVAVSKLYDFTIGKSLEKKKILAGSPWSVLFDLKNR